MPPASLPIRPPVPRHLRVGPSGGALRRRVSPWLVLAGLVAIGIGAPTMAADQDTPPAISEVFLAPLAHIPGLGGTVNLPVLGGTVNLAAEASGTPPLSYQWEFNGSPIAGATHPVLSVGPLRRQDAGTYRVVVSNHAGSVTSPGYVLQPRSWLFWDRARSVQDQRVPTEARRLLDSTSLVAISTWESQSVGIRSDGTVKVWANAGGFDLGGLLPPAGLSNVVAVVPGPGYNLALLADGSLRAWGWNAADLRIPPNTRDMVAIAGGGRLCLGLRSDGSLLVLGDNPEVGREAAAIDDAVAITAYLSWGTVRRRDGSVVHLGASLNPYASFERPSLAPPDGVPPVAAAISTMESHGIALFDDGPPRIVQQPRGVEGTIGGNALLFASAFGAPPLRYQWRRNGLPIPGETAPILAMDDLSFFDEGVYEVVVSNDHGSVVSDEARISLTTRAPSSARIAVAPHTLAPAIGSRATLTAHAEGTRPFYYRWWKDGKAIPGARGPVLELTNLQPSDSGGYEVEVANFLGTARSDSVRLTVVQVVAWGGNHYRQLEVPASATNVVAIAAGGEHGAALREDGTVVVWGNQPTGGGMLDGGALQPPAGLSNVVAVAAGAHFNAALTSDGRVTRWGGASGNLADLSNIIAVAAGQSHTLALRADGTVVARGSNNSGQLNLPPDLDDAVGIAAGSEQSLVLRRDGTIVMAGAGGNPGFTLPPVPAEATNVTALASGQQHALALRRDGTLIEWGTRRVEGVPRPADLHGILAMASGAAHDLVLLPGGRVVSWGANWLGQATPPPDLPEVTGIAAGFTHSLALVGGGPPRIVQHPLGFEALAGGNARLLVTASGSRPFRYQWRLGGMVLPGETNSLLAIDGISSFDTGAYDVIVSNALGAATSRVAAVTVAFEPPSQVTIARSPSSGIAFLGGAAQFTAASRGSSPRGYQWHFNGSILQPRTRTIRLAPLTFADSGTYSVAVANPLGTSTSAPVQLSVVNVAAWGQGPSDVIGPLLAFPPLVTNAIAVSASIRHGLVLRADGTPLEWGSGGPGQRRVPAEATNLTAVAAGYGFSVGLRRDGTVISWRDGAINNVAPESPPAGLSNVIQLVAGQDWAAAFKRDGTVTAWGRVPGGPRPFSGRTNVVQIAAGSTHALALLDDGTVLGAADWGSPESIPPEGLPPVVAIAASGYATTALLGDGTVVEWGREAVAPPEGLANLVAVAGSHWQRVGLHEDGTVSVWRTEDGVTRRVPTPPDLPPVVAIAAQDGVTLAVIPAAGEPHIARQPRSQRLFHGDALRLESSVFPGALEVTYQWLRDGVELPSQTNAILELASVTAADAGWYSVRVSNPFGSGGSREARVTVREQAPVITRHPADVITSAGSAITFTVEASGSAPLAFQWFFGDTPIPGATNGSLHISGARKTDEGRYHVVVHNGMGTAVSRVATVRLAPGLWLSQTELPVRTNGQFTVQVRLSEPLAQALRVPFSYAAQGYPPGGIDGVYREGFLVIPAGAVQQCATIRDAYLPGPLSSGPPGTLRLLEVEHTAIRPPLEAVLRMATRADTEPTCDDAGPTPPGFLPDGVRVRSDGAIELSFSVDPGQTFTVEGSIDLDTWAPVPGTYALDPAGAQVWFLHRHSPDRPGLWPAMFFYRVRFE